MQTDIVGLTSEYSCEYTYIVDKVAPTLSGLSVNVENDNCKITWKVSADADVSGYKVYRMNADGTFTYLGSRSYSLAHSYSFYDFVYNLGDGDYVYKIEAFDKVGNANTFITDPVHYEHKRVNKAPVAKIDGFEVMEIGVEEFFDAGYSSDDTGIVSYTWDFGDGTISTEVKAVKKYNKVGTYTVTLTVVDDDGETATSTIDVTVNERTAVGTVKVIVVDENGKAVPNAPVYYDLGGENQKIVYSDANGVASMLMEKGDHEVGVYKSNYLPVQKTVTVLPNATRTITMTIINQPIVTGRFEVTRMTFSEIQAAGIDVYSPENQHVYKVNVSVKYGGASVPITYIRNDSKIISYTVNDSGGDKKTTVTNNTSTKDERKISSVTFVPNEANAEVIAVLDIPASASYTKEFFDAKLHIINNATSQFVLVDNNVHLNVPDGMTLMKGLANGYDESADVHFDSLRGQETKTLNWILRGDNEGEYDLSADYSATLDKFNANVTATFKTDEPIKVYGLSSMKFIVEVNNEIRYNALYFNFGLKNVGSVDVYNPTLDFDGIVSNITASARQKDSGVSDNEKEDFEVSSVLLNVKILYNDGTSQYIPFKWHDDGTVSIDVDTLSPGDTIYYEYVAYNAINYDGLASFMEAATEVAEGYSKNVEVKPVSMSLFNTSNSLDKMKTLNSKALKYFTTDSNYYYWVQATGDNTIGNAIGRTLNNCAQLLFNFNWDVLTGEQKEELAESLILQLLTSQNVMDSVEDAISTDYLSAVKSYLSLIKSNISDITTNPDGFFEETQRLVVSYYEQNGMIVYNGNMIIFQDKEYTYEAFNDYIFHDTQYKVAQFGDIINSMLGNYKTLDKLASILREKGPETLNEKIMSEAAKIGGAALLTGGNWLARDFLSENIIVEELSKACKYTTKLLDSGILNPIKAINKATYNQSIYSAIQTNACIEEEIAILDTIIKYANNMDSDFADYVLKVAKHYKEVAKNNAASFVDETYAYFVKYTAESIGSDIAKWGTSKFLKKCFPSVVAVIYNLVSSGYGLLDDKLKISAKYKSQDGLDIAECMTSIFLENWLVTSSEYKENPDDLEKATRAMQSLKYLIQSRLIGESEFKHYIESIDKDFIKELNKETGKNYKDVEEFYDDVYKEILQNRDILFNIEETTSVIKPDAPKVTFNYSNNCTNEKFDVSYEYCLSDGEWRPCTGNAIAIIPATHASVLRVRKASGSGTVAGEITTLTINAQREISKTISAKYDNREYTFSNLLDVYSYQICFVDTAYSEPDWNGNVMTIKGSSAATLKGVYSPYLAIRTCGNEELRETTSQYRIIPVQIKQELHIDTWGNGTVAQSNSTGMYFVGDDINLTAAPSEGAVFRGWYINGELVSKDKEYILEMYPDASITAKFEGGVTVQPTNINITLIQSETSSEEELVFYTASVSSIPDVTVYDGTSARLYAGIYPENAENKNVTWKSSDTSIAVVDENGKVNFLKSGDVTITATLDNGVSTTYKIRVLANSVKYFYIVDSAKKTSYYENESLDLTGLKVCAEYLDGSVKDITDYVVGGYSNTVGTHKITLSYEGHETSFNIEVKHKTSWIVTKDSTCSENGVKSEICSICGETINTISIDKLNHDSEWIVTKHATKETAGTKSLVCKNCGEVTDTKTYEWCDHEFISSITEADCENNGYTKYTCTKCGEVIIGDETEAIGHNYIERVVAPSCGKIGYILHACSNCGDMYITDKTAALEHKYVSRTITASCAEEGRILHECEICGDSYRSDIVEKKNHTYSFTVTDPTCETSGYTTYICTGCGDTYITDEVSALGHSFTDKTVKGDCAIGSYVQHTCSTCGYSYKSDVVDPREHEFGEWLVRSAADEGHAGVMYRVCILCNKEETKSVPLTDHEHIAGDWYVEKEATCIEYGIRARKCGICNEIIETEQIEATGHSLTETTVNATCTTDGYTLHSCTKCNYSYKTDVVTATGHDESDWIYTEEATCTTDGRRMKLCNVCGQTLLEEVVEATGHTSEIWIVSKEPTCTELGEQYKVCLHCGEKFETEFIKPLGHHYVSVTTDVTCKTNGFTTFTCTNCGDHYITDEVTATGHTFGEWSVTASATHFANGTETRKCTNCDAVETRDIPMIKHSYSTVVTAPSCTEKGYTTFSCECGHSYKDNYVDALGHTDGKWEVTKPATTTEEGVKTLYCSVCGEVIKTESIPKLMTEGKVTKVVVPDVTINYKESYKYKPEINMEGNVKYTVSYDVVPSSKITIGISDDGTIYGTKRGDSYVKVTVTDDNGNTVSAISKVTVNYTWWQWIIKIVLFGWIWY